MTVSGVLIACSLILFVNAILFIIQQRTQYEVERKNLYRSPDVSWYLQIPIGIIILILGGDYLFTTGVSGVEAFVAISTIFLGGVLLYYGTGNARREIQKRGEHEHRP